MTDSNLPIKCKKCGNTKLVMNEELICTNCGSDELGFVVDENNTLDILKMKLLNGDISRVVYDKMKKEMEDKLG